VAPCFGDILNVSQVGDEKADHNIWYIVQTALFPDTVKSYSQEKESRIDLAVLQNLDECATLT